jgi:hypothetical protein
MCHRKDPPKPLWKLRVSTCEISRESKLVEEFIDSNFVQVGYLISKLPEIKDDFRLKQWACTPNGATTVDTTRSYDIACAMV